MPGSSRRVAVTIDADVGPYGRGLATATAETKAFSRELRSANSDTDRFTRSMDSSGRQIDKLSGRLELIGQFAGALGPALIPIGAAAIPAVAGLANQLGVAALAGGTAVLAFQGVGTALKALNQYQLAPTAAHLLAMQEAMSAVGPAGRDFVRQLAAMQPLLLGIQNTARAGLFPGVTEALQSIATRAPEVNHLIETISTTLGGLVAEAGNGIAGGTLDDFIRTLDEEARPALTDLGHSIADVTLGLTDLFRAFVPLSLDFGSGMAKAAAGFHAWADGLAATQGFQDFVAYLRTTGPEVLDLLAALGNDFVQIAEAAAPLGGPILQSLTAVAKAIGAIADSPLGTPIFTVISAISAYNLAMKATAALQEKTFGPKVAGNITSFGSSIRGMSIELEAANAQLKIAQAELGTAGTRARDAQFALIPTEQKRAAIRDYAAAQDRVKAAAEGVAAAEEKAAAARRASIASVGKGIAAAAALGLAATGTADKIGIANTVTLGLAGSFAGPWGAALGAGAGALLDVQHAAAPTTDAIHALNGALNETGPAAQKMHDLTKALADADKQLTDMKNHSGVGDFFHDLVNKVGSFNIGDLFKSSGKPVDLLGFGQVGTNGLDKLTSTAAKARAELAQGTPIAEQYAQSIRNSGVAAGHTAAEINGMVSAMQANRTAALGAFDAETQYRQALKAAQAQAAKNSAGLRGSSDAALANRGALSQLAAAWNNQSDAVRNNVGRYHQARQAFIDTAAAMGVPIAQAKRLADRLLAIPKSVVVKAQIAGGVEALREIDAIKARLAGIPRSISTSYYVNQINSVSKAPANFDPTHGKYGADGATVVDSGLPYADRHLYLVADREEIVSNRRGQADRYRPVLKAINADAPREQIRGMLAGGGTAGWPGGWSSTSWHMQAAPPPGNWYQQILAALREGLGGAHGGHNAISTRVNVDGVGVFSVTKSDRANAQFIADLVHQTHREKAADRLAELQAMQQVRDLRKQLAAHNKKKKDGSGGGLSLTGLDRRETQAELQQAIQQLDDLRTHADGAKQAIQQVKDQLNQRRQALGQAIGNFDLSSVLPQTAPANPIFAGAKAQLAEFESAVKAAGGTWTKSMDRHASLLTKDALALDGTIRKQSQLSDQVDASKQALASLESTMSQFGTTVAGNFQTNPFGLGGQSTTFQPTVDNSPALSAATDQLNAAKAHLAALNSNDGTVADRLANAYAAQGVAADVARLQTQVDQLSQPVVTVTDSLQAFHDTLTSDIDRANAFNAALTTLAGDGLSTDFLSALSTSGDTAFATALAGAGEQTAQQYAALFDQRNAAAAQVAATATQLVYGQQHAELVASLGRQQAALDRANALIVSQTAAINTQGAAIQAATRSEMADLRAEVSSVKATVASIPRQTEDIKRGGKGRG